MKAKTISKVLRSKFNDWKNSITSQYVKELVEANTIITGGSIASMLLGEPVNDYDIYFTDKKTAKAVAQYYVGKFNESNKSDICVLDGDNADHDNLGQLEKGRVKIYINSDGITNSKEIFNTDISEQDDIIDIVEKADESILDLGEDDKKEKYRVVFMSSNAITLSNQIQIVIRFYGDPEQIHQHYDYLHCTNYWLSKTGDLHLKHEALKCLLSRELIYVGSKYPICSIIRTRKFIKRGWHINAGQYLKMCFQVSELNLNDLRVLEEQLIGVDAAYFSILIDALKDQTSREQGFAFNYDYLSTIIDKIF